MNDALSDFSIVLPNIKSYFLSVRKISLNHFYLNLPMLFFVRIRVFEIIPRSDQYPENWNDWEVNHFFFI